MTRLDPLWLQGWPTSSPATEDLRATWNPSLPTCLLSYNSMVADFLTKISGLHFIESFPAGVFTTLWCQTSSRASEDLRVGIESILAGKF